MDGNVIEQGEGGSVNRTVVGSMGCTVFARILKLGGSGGCD